MLARISNSSIDLRGDCHSKSMHLFLKLWKNLSKKNCSLPPQVRDSLVVGNVIIWITQAIVLLAQIRSLNLNSH